MKLRRSFCVLAGLVFLAAATPAPAAPPTLEEWREEYSRRRQRVIEKLEKSSSAGAALLIRARPPAVFANDVDYPYRPENDLFYLSGIGEDGAALLLSAREIGEHGREVLFLRPAAPHEAVWVGERLSADRAAEVSGIPRGSILEPGRVAELLRRPLARPQRHFEHDGGDPARRPVLFYSPPDRFRPGDPVTPGYAFLLATFGSDAFHLDLRRREPLIAPMRQVKSAGEVAMIEKAVEATCKAHRRAMEVARAGLHEYHLAAEIEATFRLEGTSGWAFPSIVGSGPNSCILHYQKYDRRLEDGDLVVIDIGAEHGYYAADVTRTIPVSGRFTARQRAVYDIVLEAQRAAIRAIKPGLPFRDVDRAAREVVAAGLVRLGVVENAEAAGKYFPHGTSHGLGLDVHDPVPLPILEPGMVITVEPGIYLPEESLGIRIEDDVVVTEDGCRVLSNAAPRTAEEVERWMAGVTF